MFGRRFHLFSVAGFKIGLDISWFFIAILLTWSLAAGYFPIRYPNLPNATYWLMGLFGMLGLFVCIVLHELGHAVVARHYKLPINQITLFIFGGVAELEKEPTSPKVEFLMAIAGPIVSFLLALFFYLVTKMGVAGHWPAYITGVTGYLWLINFILALFNLIPAFPLDGGRVLRSILWGWKNDLAWATRISSIIGSSFGFVLIFLGIVSFFVGSFISGLWFVILGWFLYRAASSTQTQFYVSKELEGETVEKFMKKDVITVPPNLSINEFVERYLYVSHHHLYPVTDGKRFIGSIGLKEIKAVSREDWSTTLVNEKMIPATSLPTITPKTSALKALDMIQKEDHTTLFVVEGGDLAGILTAQDLFKIISLKLELEEENRRPR